MKKIDIEIKGDKRKGSCWAKHVTQIDKEKKGGFMFEGDFLNNGEHLLPVSAIVLQVETHGSWRNNSQLAYLGVVNPEGEVDWLEGFNSINWTKKKVTVAEKCSELLEQALPEAV